MNQFRELPHEVIVAMVASLWAGWDREDGYSFVPEFLPMQGPKILHVFEIGSLYGYHFRPSRDGHRYPRLSDDMALAMHDAFTPDGVDVLLCSARAERDARRGGRWCIRLCLTAAEKRGYFYCGPPLIPKTRKAPPAKRD